MTDTKFKITRTVLAEMAEMAATNNLDTSALNWTEVQQVLTLESLKRLFAIYGLSVPYKFAIDELKEREDADDTGA